MSKKLKPFDLQAALSGEPVMLRDGSKAFVRHHETELNTDEHRKLVGYTSIGAMLTWREDGRFVGRHLEPDGDIIGMYQKTRTINGFEVPTPETEAPAIGSVFFVASCGFKAFVDDNIWRAYDLDLLWLERGLVFLNEEDAVVNAKAMLGIDPDNPSTD